MTIPQQMVLTHVAQHQPCTKISIYRAVWGVRTSPLDVVQEMIRSELLSGPVGPDYRRDGRLITLGPGVMTEQEVCDLLEITSEKTIANWLHGGYFPGAFRPIGCPWYYLRADAESARAAQLALQKNPYTRDLAHGESETGWCP